VTETVSAPETQTPPSPIIPRPATDNAALRAINLPQLSIMISLQVSANRARAASDRRAIADHETLIALHEMAKQQLDIVNGQDRVLATVTKPGAGQPVAN